MHYIKKFEINDIFFNKGDFKLFEIKDLYYVWISEYLQLFKIQDYTFYNFFKLNENDKQIVRSSLSKEELIKVSESIKKLIENGKKKKIEKIETNQNLNFIILNLSGLNCNLKCKYCFAFTDQEYRPAFMQPEDIKKAIDFLIQTNPNPLNDTYFIILFGGEPFLNSKMLDFLSEYSEKMEKKINKRFVFSATTNGTIVTDAVINMFKNNKGSIMISIDGPKYIHNKNRPFKNGCGSYDKIMKNLKIFDKYRVNYTFRATLEPDCQNMLDIIRYFENLKIKYYFDFKINTKFHKNNKVEYNKNNLKLLNDQFKLVMDYFLSKIKKNELIFCINIFENLPRLHYQQGSLINCSSGMTGLTINSDGTIYTCQNLSNDKSYSIGSITNGIDTMKLKAFISPSVEEIDNCKSCWCKYLCSGNCFADKIVGDISINSYMEDRCKLTKIKWENYIKLYFQISESNPMYLNSLYSDKFIKG
jgi:uncharacterized protein